MVAYPLVITLHVSETPNEMVKHMTRVKVCDINNHKTRWTLEIWIQAWCLRVSAGPCVISSGGVLPVILPPAAAQPVPWALIALGCRRRETGIQGSLEGSGFVGLGLFAACSGFHPGNCALPFLPLSGQGDTEKHGDSP